MKVIWKSRIAFLFLGGLAGTGCVQKDYYMKPETSSHGVVTMKKVNYTPEQLAARDASRPAPSDPGLAEIEESWPKLTQEQRASLVQTVKQMTAPR